MTDEITEPHFEPLQHQAAQFVVDLEGFEGPLDVLLLLARKQKVDIKKISILALAEQYLEFIEQVRHTYLDLAAEYLVMAAWFAYLKSRLLLPQEENQEEALDAHMQAEILTWRLARLQAMRDMSDRLMARTRLGVDIFARGRPEGIRLIRTPIWRDRLYDLVSVYALQKAQKGADKAYRVERRPVMSVEDAYKHLSKRLQLSLEWELLEVWLPQVHIESQRSTLASAFAAMLIMAKDGLVELKQKTAFAPIYMRQRQDQRVLEGKTEIHAA